MKSIVDYFLTWWLHTGRYRWSWLRRRLCEWRYLKTALPGVTSLEEIESCLKQVTWTRDGPLHLFDCISYPQATWAKKKDDCDGFASLASELLRRLESDYKPVLVTAMLIPVRRSHTVCAFHVSGGKLWFFDNDRLRQGDFGTYAEIVDEIKGEARLVCWDVVEPDTLQAIEFHKA
jgi:hypothetical protein